MVKCQGETPVHHIKNKELQNKTFHAGINLPEENVCKRRGARIVYIKEENMIKIIYAGGHKDQRYDNSFYQVQLIEIRYNTNRFIEYSNQINLETLKN
ncbi:MAG: hypothetical protein CEN90_468 [Parcubacteria group bacterium Licking1014_17]|nr:MAG: hypothetical protein CEN90_468 [Parcubacteria group bacterium Licking1014_17]